MEEKHKSGNEAIKKLKSLAKEVPICMMATHNVDQDTFTSRPMNTADVDEEGCFWYFTNEHTRKVEDQQKDETVYLIHADPTNHTYFHIKGKAQVVHSESKKDNLWNPIIKAWYPKGKDDPDLCLLKVHPEEVKFWNASSNKMEVLFHAAKAIATNSQYNEGETGTLDLKNENKRSSIH
jgi:general stress protein 26